MLKRIDDVPLKKIMVGLPFRQLTVRYTFLRFLFLMIIMIRIQVFLMNVSLILKLRGFALVMVMKFGALFVRRILMILIQILIMMRIGDDLMFLNC